MKKQFFVYIASNRRNTVLYAGITNDLPRRMYEHKHKIIKGFTKKYNIDKLVYFEKFRSPKEAILAEKRIKGWTRAKKVELVKKVNPDFKDLLF